MYKEVNDCASSDISELLGSALIVYKKVIFCLLKKLFILSKLKKNFQISLVCLTFLKYFLGLFSSS